MVRGRPVCSSDYNDFFTANGAVVSFTAPSLAAWRAATGQDAHSLGADPLFVNSTLGDYHLQSTGGSWHGGTFSADMADSPCIDAGDPTMPVGAEPAPNGGRINLGAYGGTAQASKTPTIRVLTLISPNGGEVCRGIEAVRWDLRGLWWGPLRHSCALFLRGQRHKLDNGHRRRRHSRNTRSIHLARLQPPSGQPLSGSNRLRPGSVRFQFFRGRFFSSNRRGGTFVNDAYDPASDQYCTSAGSDINDGLTPATPQSSIEAILNSYGLQPGDTVFVDAGITA